MKHLQADLTAFCETTIYSSHALMGSDINYSPSLSARENPDRAEHRVCGGGVLEPKAVRRQGSRTHAHTHKQRPLRRGISVDNRGKAKRGVALPVQIASVQPKRRSAESETDILGADARKSVPHWDANPTDPGRLGAKGCLE